MDTDILLSLLFIFLLLLFSGFFSGSETGLTALSRARLYHLVKEGNKRAAMVAKLREQKESLIGTILLGNNLVNILASALATSVSISLWGDAGVAYATIAMTMLVLIFAEVLPKTYAIERAEQVALAVAPLLMLIVKLLSPFTHAVRWFNRRLLALFSINLDEQDSLISAADVLRGTIEMHHEQGDMERQDRDMLGGILELEETTVDEVMVHRKHIDAIDLDDSIVEIINQATSSSHSRIPIYRENYNQIVGILHIKNLLRLINEKGRAQITSKDILKACSKPWFIPSSTSLKDQLYAFRQRRQHFSLVVDEYGSLQGIITLEDIIEEIVGEIDDEYDTINPSDIVELQPDMWLVDGDVSIRDLNRHLDWNLPDEEATTLGGLVMHEARDIPEVGQHFTIQDIRFTIEARSANQITRMKIEKTPEPGDEASTYAE